MVIHIVKAGDTLSALAAQYGVPLSLLAVDNGFLVPRSLVVGQALVVRFPEVTHTVRPGETLTAIARQYGVSLRQLYRNNLILEGRPTIWPGQTLVISYQEDPGQEIFVNAYAYPFIDPTLLTTTLPFLTFVTPFTYGFTSSGDLVTLNDRAIISAAKTVGTAPLMHFSTLTQEGGFSNDLAHLALNDASLQERIIENILSTMQKQGYQGLDVDFEYVFPEDAQAYADFLGKLTRRLNPLGYPVIAALAPKTSATQLGALYEGHSFAAIGAAVNMVLLMTYEWYVLTHRLKSIDMAGFKRCLHTFLSAFSGSIQQYTFWNGLVHILNHYNADGIVNVRASMEFVARIPLVRGLHP